MATVCLRIGYKVMSEIYGAKDLVENALAAETAGFDLVSTSDHFHPRMKSQRPSPYAWGVPGAIAAGHHSCGPRHGGTFIGPDAARRRGKKSRKLLPRRLVFPPREGVSTRRTRSLYRAFASGTRLLHALSRRPLLVADQCFRAVASTAAIARSFLAHNRSL
jgi:hypothetical protein